MVITDINQVVYQGDGATTAFPFTFRIIDATDIKLLLIDADGTETDITSDYFVDTVNNTVHYPGYTPGAEPGLADQPAPVQEGQRLVVYRELPVTQEKDLGEKWPFFVIELALDKLTMLIQGISGIWNRCLRVTVGQSATHPDFDYNIPIEAGKTFRVKDDETGFELTEDPAVAHAAAVAAQEAAERAQGAAEEAQGKAEDAQEDAETAKGAAEAIASQIDIMARALVYDTVAAMKADTTLVAGMTAGTKGYYAINDGGSAVYTIRAKTQDDIDDGGSFIFLNNGNVAEMITNGVVTVEQFGAKGDGVTDDTDAVRNAIAVSKKIVFGKEKTYNLMTQSTSNIYVPANRTIDLNGATLDFKGYGFCNCSKNRADFVYDGNGNITIKNGNMLGGEVLLAHGKNIILENLHFKNRTGHYIQIMSCYNVLITHCSFCGMGVDANNTDAINLDPCVVSAFHVYGEGSPAYDGTNNSHITIEYCECKQGTDEGYTKPVYLGVSHYHVSEEMFHEYVTIKDNKIEVNDENTYGLKLYDLHYGQIHHNTFIGGSTPITMYYGESNTISDNIRIASSSFTSAKTISFNSDSNEKNLSVYDNADTVNFYIPIGVTMREETNISFKKTSPIRLTGNISADKDTDISLSMPYTLFNRMQVCVGAAGSGTFEIDLFFGAFSTTKFTAGTVYSALNGAVKLTCDADNPRIIRCNSPYAVRRVFAWTDPYI